MSYCCVVSIDSVILDIGATVALGVFVEDVFEQPWENRMHSIMAEMIP